LLVDTSGANTFVGTPAYSYFVTGGVVNEALGFPDAVAYAAPGTQDTALLSGGSGSNSFVGTPGYSFLASGTGAGTVVTEAVSFRWVRSTATGPTDTAQLTDSAGGDTFLGQGPSATLYGASYFIDLEGYYAVTLFGTAGAVNRLHTTALDYLFSTQGNWTAF